MAAVEESKSVVPESMLKKRKRAEEWALAKKQEAVEKKAKDRENRKLIFSRAQQYAKEYEAHVLTKTYFLDLIGLFWLKFGSFLSFFLL